MATLVARETSPEEVFAAVAEEMGRLERLAALDGQLEIECPADGGRWSRRRSPLP